MKRVFTSILSLLLMGQLFAGGIVTNSNQSAMYPRLLARDAVISIDNVYFNPAGLSFLPNDGFYLSINNQTLGQTKTITSDYEWLNNNSYEGKISAPIFPGLYVAYKMNDFTFSAGFNPIGGGGGGVYNKGLPSFEYGISDLKPALTAAGLPVESYSMDVNFEGTAAYFGYQANVSYKVTDQLSVALGGRFVSAKESYKGYLKNTNINMLDGSTSPASAIFTSFADTFRPGLAGLNDMVTGGAGAYTLAQAEGAGVIDAATRAGLEGGLDALGVTDPSALTVEQAQQYFQGAVTQYDNTATMLGDQEADYEKTATGFTPIISIDYKLNDQFNFSFKYEHNTTLEFTNKTAKDLIIGYEDDGITPITQFPDGEKSNLDIPGQIVVGATYHPIEKLMLSTGYHMFLDKNANWTGKEDDLDGNSWEFAIGAEYDINDMFIVSGSWLRTNSGVKESYQSDLSYSLPSSTFGGGFAVNINPKIQLNVGGSYTMYTEGERNFNYESSALGASIPVKETYDKDVWIVAVGLNFNFGAE